MFNIRIITLGKLKESHWKQAEAEYLKRLGPYAKVEIIELKEEAFRNNDSPEVIKQKEAEKLLPYIDSDGLSIALHERGKEMDSVTFAKFLERSSTSGQKITVIIGGPLGLAPMILEKMSMQISLSQLTFPHQMVRPILLEQLYRSATIIHNKKYHY